MINIKVALILTLFSYFLDLKRKMEKIAMQTYRSNDSAEPSPVISIKKRLIRTIAITTNVFWILFKSPRTLKSFLKIQFQLLHHCFSLSINKFTILN